MSLSLENKRVQLIYVVYALNFASKPLLLASWIFNFNFNNPFLCVSTSHSQHVNAVIYMVLVASQL